MSLLHKLLASVGKREPRPPTAGVARRPRADPSSASADLTAIVIDLVRQERHAEAYGLARDAVEKHPHEVQAAFASAFVLGRWGRQLEAAQAFHDAAARARPRDPEISLQHGWTLLYSGDASAAERAMSESVAAKATAEAYFGLACARRLRGDLAGALASLETCIGLDPANVNSHLLAATCEDERGDKPAAERRLRQGIAQDPHAAACWRDLGVVLEELGRYKEAHDAYLEAVRLERIAGRSEGSAANAAVALRSEGRCADALRLLAEETEPPTAHRQFVHSAALLTAGQLEPAWEFHEFRWAFGPLLEKRSGLVEVPPWVGQDLAGKAILLRAEQGMGDSIQMLRYASWLKRLGATVHVRLQTPLVPLGTGFHGVDVVQLPDAANAQVDYCVHPMSLPKVFGTDLATIPVGIPYVDVDPALGQLWKQRIAQSTAMRVGLAWAGNAEHQRDRHRSLRLAALAPLLLAPGVQFYSLQKGGPEREIASLAGAPRPTDLAPELSDMADTAAAIDQLDLVIAVDTAVAHLAGALGKPVWMLIADPPDFRWMLERTDSPWYPSMRIFRQETRGDWTGVVGKVAEELCAIAGARERWPKPVRVEASTVVPSPVRPASNIIPGTTRLIEARYGLVEYLPDEPLVGPSIAFYGEYRQVELLELLRRCQPGSTVAVIGAGIGHDVLALAVQVGPAGHVIAWESRPRQRAALLHNVATNRLRQVTVMSRRPVGSDAPAREAGAESIDDLQLDTLAWVVVNAGIDALAALQGAEETLWRRRPGLLVRVRSPEALRPVADTVRNFGYRCWKVETPLFDAGNFNRWPEDIFGGHTAVAVIAIAEELDVTPAAEWVALD